MGVTQERGKFRARYSFMGERINLGYFDTELKAKRAITKDRKEKQEAYDFMKPMSHDPDNFLETPVDPDKKIYPPKPSIMDRIKAKIEGGKKWLNEQLDK